MKRHIVFIVAVVVVVVLSCLAFWYRSSYETEGGLKGKKVSAETLKGWLNNRNDAVFEIADGDFYVQEAIGSQGVSLTRPQKLFGDFAIRFDLMSSTKFSVAKLIIINSANGEAYSFEIRQREDDSIFKIHHNGVLLGEVEHEVIEPNVFYAISLEKQEKHIALGLGEKTLWKQDFPEGTGRKAVFNMMLNGLPDHPAAITIRNMKIYSQD